MLKEGSVTENIISNPDLPKDVVNELNGGLTGDERLAVTDALNQISIDEDWFKEYGNVSSPEIKAKFRDTFGKIFGIGGETLGKIGVLVMSRYEHTKNLQGLRMAIEPENPVPKWLAIITLPPDLSHRLRGIFEKFGEKVGEATQKIIEEAAEEIYEERLEGHIRAHLRSERAIEDDGGTKLIFTFDEDDY